MTDITKLIAKLEPMLAAGTHGGPNGLTVSHCNDDGAWAIDGWNGEFARTLSEPDARLFAACGPALRALIDEVWRLREECSDTRETLEQFKRNRMDDALGGL